MLTILGTVSIAGPPNIYFRDILIYNQVTTALMNKMVFM